MLGSIRYNLGNLTNFEGRDARQTFWFYALFLVIAQFAVSLISSIPLYISIFSNVFSAASSGGDTDAVMLSMVSDMVDQIILQSVIGVVLGVIVTGLFVASFVRRLHDAGFTGWIAAVPVVTQLMSGAFTLSFLGELEDIVTQSMAQSMANPGGAPDMAAMQAETGWFGLVGWIGYIVVIGFGVLKSQEGPNVYGEGPVRF